MDLLVINGELKDSAKVNNLVAGEEDCTFVTEVLGEILDTESGTVTPQRESLMISSP